MRKSLENDSTVEIRVVNTCSFDDKLNLQDNAAEMLDNRLPGNFTSKNFVNVSQQNLTGSEISLLSKVFHTSKLCGGKKPPSHSCKKIKDTCTFKSKHLDEIHKINKKNNCNSKMAVYLVEYQKGGNQYTGSTKAKYKTNNYNSTQ